MAFSGQGSGRFQITRIRKGDSAVSVYRSIAATAAAPATPATGTTFPPTSWSATPLSVTENSVVYQSNGVKDELTSIYTWDTPFVIGRGPRGAGFYRIARTGAKPATTFVPANHSPSLTEYRAATGITGAEFVTGDLVIITYAEQDSAGDSSWAVSFNGSTWEVAGEFIDGNLIVDGSVFSTVSYSVGIPDINSALVWENAADEVPTINPSWVGSGAFLGFADNDTSGSSVTQEILLVGDAANHLLFDGETITLSGVRLEDPTILVTEPPDAGLVAWTDNTLYEVGDLVTFSGDIYQCIVEHTSSTAAGMIPTLDTLWDNITAQVAATNTFVPAVYVGETAPASATEGDLWYDETIGRMFIFFTSTWADVTKN